MKVVKVKDKKIWNDFVNYQITQTWEWGEFQKSLGKEVYRLGAVEGGEFGMVALCIKEKRKLGNMIYIPAGPVFEGNIYKKNFVNNTDIGLDKNKSKLISSLIDHIRNHFNDIYYIKIEPRLVNTFSVRKEFRKIGFVQCNSAIQANNKWMLDLEKSKEELRDNLHQSGDYKIRKAKRRGVKTYSSTKMEDFEKFWSLFGSNATNADFEIESKDYYKKQFKTFTESGKYKIFWAETEESGVLATYLIGYHGEVAFYLHGATQSLPNKKMLEAPRCLMWEAIADAKDSGYRYFDFYGISAGAMKKYLDDEDTNIDIGVERQEKWSGFSRFKMSFDGFGVPFINSFDYPFSWKYKVESIIRKVFR